MASIKFPDTAEEYCEIEAKKERITMTKIDEYYVGEVHPKYGFGTIFSCCDKSREKVTERLRQLVANWLLQFIKDDYPKCLEPFPQPQQIACNVLGDDDDDYIIGVNDEF